MHTHYHGLTNPLIRVRELSTCTLDLASGYWQVVMDDADKQKTAFATHKWLFQFKLTIRAFQQPNHIWTSHESHTFFNTEGVMSSISGRYQYFRINIRGKIGKFNLSFRQIKIRKLKLKPEECVSFQEQVSFLEHIVSHDGIRCNPENISAVRDWPTPTSVTEEFHRNSFLLQTLYRKKF